MTRTSAMQQLTDRFAPISISGATGRFVATLACTKCPKTETWSSNKMPSPETVQAKFRARGWSKIEKAPNCKACASAEVLASRERQRQRREQNRGPGTQPAAVVATPQQEGNAMQTAAIHEMKPSAISAVTILAPATEAERTAAARKGHRDTIAALEIYFDEKAGAYRECKNDAIIAAEIGLAPSYVAKVREEFFGPLKVPGEIAAIEARIDALAAQAADAYAKIAANFDAAVAQLRRDLAALAAKNGWAK